MLGLQEEADKVLAKKGDGDAARFKIELKLNNAQRTELLRHWSSSPCLGFRADQTDT